MRVVRKAKDPTWRPGPGVRAEHKKNGEILPAVVPPGPDNPLGTRAMYLGWPQYLIHGTNKPYGVGLRSSHGCIRMYPEDVEMIYEYVQTGERVTVVNQPFVFGWHEGQLYLQAFDVLEDDPRNWQKAQKRLLSRALAKRIQKELKARNETVNWELISKFTHDPRGIPVSVSRADASIEAIVAAAPRVQNRVPDNATWDGTSNLPADDETMRQMFSKTSARRSPRRRRRADPPMTFQRSGCMGRIAGRRPCSAAPPRWRRRLPTSTLREHRRNAGAARRTRARCGFRRAAPVRRRRPGRRADRSAATRLVLDTRDLVVREAWVVESPTVLASAPFAVGETVRTLGEPLTVTVPAGPVGSRVRVRISYQTRPGASGLQWLDAGQTAGKTDPFLFTQSQAIHARSWIPLQDTAGAARDLRRAHPRAAGPARCHERRYHAGDAGGWLVLVRGCRSLSCPIRWRWQGRLEHREAGPRTLIYAEPPVIEAAARVRRYGSDARGLRTPVRAVSLGERYDGVAAAGVSLWAAWRTRA
ncbi:MAG: L,D-transpeptidase family protein [Steroidobacteraceae bacterium]